VIEISSQKDSRYAYREILQGYSHIEEENFYIKHFKESDLGFVDTVYKKCIDSCKKKGLLSREEKLTLYKKEDLIDENLFEEKIQLEYAVKEGFDFARGLSKKQSEEFLENNVLPKEKRLRELEKEIKELIEPVSESLCNKKLNEEYVYHSLYKDKQLSNPFLSRSEFEDLSFVEVNELVEKYNYYSSKFTEININVIAVNSFFLNTFFMSDDDPVKFYGKNVLDLTMYQLNLFSRGKFYKSVLMEGKEPPEKYYSEDAEKGLIKLVQWYETAYGQIRNERERSRR
tara:strand:- start:1701 stop:2558 length:858 start_codon:yes stop_codon:yes gene_type:complete